MEYFFTKEDLNVLLFELFAKVDIDKCDETVIQFIHTHPELLKKVFDKNTYGIPENSTALHMLAKENYGTVIESGYMSNTFFRNIYKDITIIINCLHNNLGNKELYNNLKNSNIINKTDSDGNTVLDLVNEKLKKEPDSSKYKKLKEILEVIRRPEKPPKPIKSSKTVIQPEDYDETLKSSEVKFYKIIIDESSIVQESINNKQKIIKLKQTKSKKPYRVLVGKKKTKKNSSTKPNSNKSKSKTKNKKLSM